MGLPPTLAYNPAMRTMTPESSRPGLRLLVALACVLAQFAISGSVHAQPARAPDIYFEPTPESVVAEIVSLAEVRPGDVVYDLGCGDGRIVIAAAKAGAQGVCVDIDPVRIRESRANARAAGVYDRLRFVEDDLFTTGISDATVVVLFLWPALNLKLRPRLWRELRPGARIVSYVHDMGDWKPDKTLTVEGRFGTRELYLWTIKGSEPK
jgi:SAM-dependent methyltransferase